MITFRNVANRFVLCSLRSQNQIYVCRESFCHIVHFAMLRETTMDCFLYKYSGVQVSAGICTVDTYLYEEKEM